MPSTVHRLQFRMAVSLVGLLLVTVGFLVGVWATLYGLLLLLGSTFLP